MPHLIKVEDLKRRLDEKKHLVVVDVRFELTDESYGHRVYQEGHIPGAIYFDLNKDLSSPVSEHGGAHPLPDLTYFAKKIGKNGIDTDTLVVIYDHGRDMTAARFWWMLQAIGHPKISVLDGGLTAWKEAGLPLETTIPKQKPTVYKVRQAYTHTITIEELKEKLKNKSAILIDSRAKERYLGQTEPLYHKAGHIPGAKNFFWEDVFMTNGQYKDDVTLKQHFEKLPKDTPIIVSCGSGVSACPNILALKKAGYENVYLYPGGYSDWISYGEHPVETKEE
ncbi:MAG TPA: sulfurtransferase [Cerasibacillus sp.]|uniref:sulfurtransferase n=1 Tax=Cerasibacillus sp. TaxID=2498711 RepID=UPI002F429288